MREVRNRHRQRKVETKAANLRLMVKQMNKNVRICWQPKQSGHDVEARDEFKRPAVTMVILSREFDLSEKQQKGHFERKNEIELLLNVKF